MKLDIKIGDEITTSNGVNWDVVDATLDDDGIDLEYACNRKTASDPMRIKASEITHINGKAVVAEVDWQSAPSWANVRLQHKKYPSSVVWAASHEDDAPAVYTGENGAFDLEADQWELIAERPAPSTDWEGGLPPANEECEYIRNDVKYRQEYVKVTPLCFGNALVLLRHSASGNEYTESIASCEFRPIPTQAQIEAQERERVIDKACNMVDRNDTLYRAACVWYDAGLLQEPKP